MKLDASGFIPFWLDLRDVSSDTMDGGRFAGEIARLAPCMVPLSACRAVEHIPSIDEEWDWYALSRINDHCILPFQADHEHPWKHGPIMSELEYLGAFAPLGFTALAPTVGERFLPHRHEIHAVEQSSDDKEPITIVRTIWPGLWFGSLVFSRAGVVVRGGRRHIVKEIAERSILYFSYRRLVRETRDLSMGWGSNSQWRTSFRFDHEADGIVRYHVNGINLLWDETQAYRDSHSEDLTIQERIELCRNRCFLTVEKPDQDLWPYYDSYREKLEL